MPSGQYIIDDSKSIGRADTSFRSCMIAIVIFLLFCVTVIIVAYVLKTNNKAAPDESGGTKGGGSSSALAGETHHSPSTTLPPVDDSGLRHRSGSEPKETDDSAPGPVSADAPAHAEATSTTVPSVATPTAGVESRRGSEDSAAGGGHPPAEAGSSMTTAGPLPPPPPPPPTTSPFPTNPDVCKSVECMDLAANMLNMMGHGANPCWNFYDYACGGLRRNKYLLGPDYAVEAFLRINSQVSEGSVNDSSPSSYHKFKTLLESCNTYDTNKNEGLWREEVNNEMENLGLVITDGVFTPNFTHIFLGLLQHDRPFIFDVSLDVNDTDTTKFALKIFPSELMVDQYYPEQNDIMECQAETVKKYRETNTIYTETLNCMNRGDGKKIVLDAAKEALKALNILQDADKADKLNETLSNYAYFLDVDQEALGDKAQHNLEIQRREVEIRKTTVMQLNILFENLEVDWKLLIERLINRTLDESENVLLYGKTYFADIADKFKNDARQRLHEALVVAFATARHRQLLVAQERWRRAPEPQLYCTRLAALLMPDVASSLYLRSFGDARKPRDDAVRDLFFEITGALAKEVERARWLRDGTLGEDLVYKNSHLKPSYVPDFAHKDYIARLDDELQHYAIQKDNFVTNAINLMIRNRKLLYGRIDKKPEDCIWTHFIHPFDSDGKAIYSLNVIAIPLGATEKPFFHPDYPPHIRMAGLGFVVAHEIAHHYDTIGVKFNTTMTLDQLTDYQDKVHTLWGDRHDLKIMYLNETGSRRDHVLNYKLDHYISDLKKIEIMTDMIAIKIAFKALNESKMKENVKNLPFLPLTIKKGFFIHLAQKFCTKMDFFSRIVEFFETPSFPEEPRIDLMMKNSDFSEAFNCVDSKKDLDFPYGISTEADLGA